MVSKKAVQLVDYFFNKVFCKDNFFNCYNGKYDRWTAHDWECFVWNGKSKGKFTYTHPSLTLHIELYNINIINRYMKEKIYLVDKNKI